jgi:hypothetical protein
MTTGDHDAELKTHFYIISLDNGQIRTTTQINGRVKAMSVGADQRLYMNVINWRALWTDNHFFEEHPADYYQTWFCRVSLG